MNDELSISTTVGELDVEVYFDHSPAEPEEGEQGYSLGYPGCDARVEINTVRVKINTIDKTVDTVDILPLLNNDIIEDLEIEALESVNGE